MRISLEVSVPPDDRVVRMSITFDDDRLLKGVPLEEMHAAKAKIAKLIGTQMVNFAMFVNVATLSPRRLEEVMARLKKVFEAEAEAYLKVIDEEYPEDDDGTDSSSDSDEDKSENVGQAFLDVLETLDLDSLDDDNDLGGPETPDYPGLEPSDGSDG